MAFQGGNEVSPFYICGAFGDLNEKDLLYLTKVVKFDTI